MECVGFTNLARNPGFLQGKAVDLNYRMDIEVGQFSGFESVRCH